MRASAPSQAARLHMLNGGIEALREERGHLSLTTFSRKVSPN